MRLGSCPGLREPYCVLSVLSKDRDRPFRVQLHILGKRSDRPLYLRTAVTLEIVAVYRSQILDLLVGAGTNGTTPGQIAMPSVHASPTCLQAHATL